MFKGSENVYPTQMSAVLLRLYLLETGRKEDFNPLHLLDWWIEKIESPDKGDDWLTGQKWRQLARHIHALIAFNFPCLAEASGYDLGIENALIPKPEIKTHPDGKVYEHWSMEAYRRSLPPFGFEIWQRPLKCISYPCDSDELDEISTDQDK